jgi:hypothetical protein
MPDTTLLDIPRVHKVSEKTSRYCWSTYFHAVQPRLLRWILQVPVPSTTEYARHNFRHGVLANSLPRFFKTGM